jgi:hypothetical protein
MKTYSRRGGIAPHFFNFGARCRRVVNFTFLRFYPREGNPILIEQEAPSTVWTFGGGGGGGSFVPTGIQTLNRTTLSLVAILTTLPRIIHFSIILSSTPTFLKSFFLSFKFIDVTVRISKCKILGLS